VTVRLALALATALAAAAPSAADASRTQLRRPAARRAAVAKRAPRPARRAATPRRVALARAPRAPRSFVYDPAMRAVRGAAADTAAREPWRRFPLGATYLGNGQTSFVVWAPRATAVDVALDGGAGARVALRRGKDGYFHGIAAAAPGARYKLALRRRGATSVDLFPDPASRHQPDGVHGASEVVDLRFAWNQSEATFRPPALADHLIYQLHVGTFTREGTLAAAGAHMDEVAGVGFTAAQPLPVTQFPGARNWGYDPSHLYAVHDGYGGPAGMKSWVESTHGAGMAAVVDLVYNHPGPEGNYLGAFGPYFEGGPTPWGRSMTATGAARPHVWRYFIENALQWVADYHIDGIRLDASHALPPAFVTELKRATDNLSRQLGRRIVVIAEDNRNDGAIVTRGPRTGRHTRGADAQWSTDPWHAWRVLHTGERESYLADFADDPLGSLARGVRRGWVYEGQTAPSTGRARGTPAGRLRGETHVLPMGDHDQYGNTATGDRLSARVSRRVQRSTDFMRYLLPVIPQVFMGDEWGTRTPFLYFVDHGDPVVREGTRQGRMNEFREFFDKNGGETPDPTAQGTHARSVLDHGEKAAGGSGARRVALHRALIALRKSHPALRGMSKRSMQVVSFPRERALVVRRWANGREIVAVFNLGDRPTTLDLRGGDVIALEDATAEARRPLTGRFAPALHSEERRFGGSGARLAAFDGAQPTVTLPAHGAAYFDRALR
jgi:maltooligosyltrehalose trehalohydrolase